MGDEEKKGRAIISAKYYEEATLTIKRMILREFVKEMNRQRAKDLAAPFIVFSMNVLNQEEEDEKKRHFITEQLSKIKKLDPDSLSLLDNILERTDSAQGPKEEEVD